tara:strand:- start:497 stop:691 length:195 start_codon:yes stop_codon:yes gene_type:complete
MANAPLLSATKDLLERLAELRGFKDGLNIRDVSDTLDIEIQTLESAIETCRKYMEYDEPIIKDN